MALDATRLGQAMLAAFKTAPPTPESVIGHAGPWSAAEMASYTAAKDAIMWAAVGAAVVNEIKTNAVVSPGTLVAHVTNQSLGITPNPNNAATAIVAPASPVDVPVTGSGTIT